MIHVYHHYSDNYIMKFTYFKFQHHLVWNILFWYLGVWSTVLFHPCQNLRYFYPSQNQNLKRNFLSLTFIYFLNCTVILLPKKIEFWNFWRIHLFACLYYLFGFKERRRRLTWCPILDCKVVHKMNMLSDLLY